VVTNLFRDQLDRYGEADTNAEFLRRAIALAPKATLILNGDDPVTVAMASAFSNKKIFFGIKNKEFEKSKVPNEGKLCPLCKSALTYNFYHFSQLGNYSCKCGFVRPEPDINAKNVSLFPALSFEIENMGKISLNGRGKYNIYNILAVASCLYGTDVSFESLLSVTENYKPQAGRLEKFNLLGKDVYLLLAKNPAGFNQSVETCVEDPSDKDIIIAVNDGIGDGKDISWLWDVDFEDLLVPETKSISLSGTRYADVGLRFKYAGVDESGLVLSTEIKERLCELIKAGSGKSIYLLVNYTALFPTQAILKELEAENNGN